MRYRGQEHSGEGRFVRTASSAPTSIARTIEAFHDAHEREYSFRLVGPGRAGQLPRRRLLAVAPSRTCRASRRAGRTAAVALASTAARGFRRGRHPRYADLRARAAARGLLRSHGPAIIEEPATTIDRAAGRSRPRMDAFGNIRIAIDPQGRGAEHDHATIASPIGGLALALAFAAAIATACAQQRVLRHDESAPGRLDPSKVVRTTRSSVLLMNAYDTLVEAKPGGGVAPALAESWTISAGRQDLHLHAAARRQVPRTAATLTAEDVVVLARTHAGAERRLCAAVQGRHGQRARPRTVVFTLPEPNATFLAALVRLPVMQKSIVMQEHQARQPLRRQGRLRRSVPRGRTTPARAPTGSPSTTRRS